MELSPFYEKKIECIHCKKTFPTYKVRSKSVRVSSTASDFQPIYLDDQVNALFYNVFVCEHCGFSFTEDFSKYFAPGTPELIQGEITSRWVQHSFNGERTPEKAMEAYKLAYLCASLKKEKNIIMAGLLLRVAWMYRMLDQSAQELRFIKMARDQYTESYSNEDYRSTQMTETRVAYMIAELSRRLEDYPVATRFFSRVIESQRNGGEPKVVEMAKQQWELVREQRAYNQAME